MKNLLIMNSQERHIFEFFSNQAIQAVLQSQTNNFSLVELELVNRIAKVLRMAPGEIFGVFNDSHHALLEIISIGKKKVECTLLKFEENQSNKNHITLAVGAVRQSVFEEIVQNCSAIGVDKIVQIKTDKSQASGSFNKERIQQISIGAREQSKNYNSVQINDCKSFEALIEDSKDSLILIALPDGAQLDQLKGQFKGKSITIIVGPPEGWSEKELLFIKNAGFSSFTLGKNILKTELAATLSAGAARALE